MGSSHGPSTSEEKLLVLTQYQLALESADRYDERRLTVDKFFTTVIFTLFLLGGSLSVFSTPAGGLYLRAMGSILILTTISALCLAWLEYVRRSYTTSLIKRHIIRRLEQSEVYPLPCRPSLMEYQLWRSYNLSKGYLIPASEGKLRRLAATSTLWPYMLGFVSIASIALLYFLVIDPPISTCGTSCASLDNATIVFRTWLVIVAIWFSWSVSWNLIQQSNVARDLDGEPDGGASL